MEVVDNRCGDGVFWFFNQYTACITISGTGKMKNYEDAAELPWQPYLNRIRKVVVGKGVTSVGDGSFCSCENLKVIILAGTVKLLGVCCFGSCTSLVSVTIPEGVRVIGAKAFRHCTALWEVHLPATLTNIDMRAFSGDSALARVYYSGTRLQWEQVRISMAASDNQYLAQADIQCSGTPVDVTLLYKDIKKTDWFITSLQYLEDYGFLDETDAQAAGICLGPLEPVKMDFVLEMLYTRGGRPGMYDSAGEWAEDCGLIGCLSNGQREKMLSLDELAVILYRTARYNRGGEAATEEPGEEKGAYGWCDACGYLAGLPAKHVKKVLTRGEAVMIMAAYLKSSASSANRYPGMINEIKTALKQGGDGKVYIAVPNLTEPGITAKSGDCTLIVFPDGQTMLIDAGYMACSSHVISLLENLGLTRLDYVVLSHTHDDHSGGLMAVAQYIYGHENGYIGNYYRSSCVVSKTEPPFLKYIQEKGTRRFTDVKAGDRWNISGVTIDMFNPEERLLAECTGRVEELNNVSILMKFTYGTSTFLTGGDLYQNREMELASVYGEVLKADILKANHHGTYTSNCGQWLKTVSPAVIFAPADDVGDTPFVWRAARMGIAYYSVGVDGLVIISLDDNRNYKVVSQYDSPLRQNYRGIIGRSS